MDVFYTYILELKTDVFNQLFKIQAKGSLDNKIPLKSSRIARKSTKLPGNLSSFL